MKSAFAKTLYALLFVAVLPAALVAWARTAESAIRLPILHSTIWGAVLATSGLAILLSGMLSLRIYGDGLPMNAFPPRRFVNRGAYALIPHPIYGGFVMVCGGVAIFCGSGSGLWLVTPTVALGCTALVLGYELPDLRRRFGAQPLGQVPEGNAVPTPAQRLRTMIAVLVPWLGGYGMIWLLGPSPDARSTYLAIERRIPIVGWTELTYASTYLVVVITPILVKNAQDLRWFARRGILASIFLFSLYLLLPFFVPPRSYSPSTLIVWLMSFERTRYSGAAAFPSFHVVWALIAAAALGRRGRVSHVLWWTWAVLVSVSCLTTGMHSLLDVLAGCAAFVLVVKAEDIWHALLHWAEWTANSWREWRIGPVRIINHGGYAGLAALVGVLLIGGLMGQGHELVVANIYLCSIVGAVLWAQIVEGSPALLRPLGFYGGLLGAILGAIPVFITGMNVWIALAAISVAAPWIQALGRIRCLVQGCCHGRATETVEGIRYTHPRSRVCRLANLKGIPIHATPLYSIAWNCWVGSILIRLVTLHAACAMIAGIYLILSGAGRFVEEAYRGEPQTKVIGGLRLYQWIAAATMIAGAILTTVRSTPLPDGLQPDVSLLLLASVCGAITWFVSGVDFPESNRRFARLT
jgi:prolipoprotein diacylglyceryltransferase/membrane-associated phospholipid phosphatase/protein-S-isoprenylcysteine O-methyltransferase Ste14